MAGYYEAVCKSIEERNCKATIDGAEHKAGNTVFTITYYKETGEKVEYKIIKTKNDKLVMN